MVTSFGELKGIRSPWGLDRAVAPYPNSHIGFILVELSIVFDILPENDNIVFNSINSI